MNIEQIEQRLRELAESQCYSHTQWALLTRMAIPGQQQKRMKQHLEQCPDCRRRLESVEQHPEHYEFLDEPLKLQPSLDHLPASGTIVSLINGDYGCVLDSYEDGIRMVPLHQDQTQASEYDLLIPSDLLPGQLADSVATCWNDTQVSPFHILDHVGMIGLRPLAYMQLLVAEYVERVVSGAPGKNPDRSLWAPLTTGIRKLETMKDFAHPWIDRWNDLPEVPIPGIHETDSVSLMGSPDPLLTCILDRFNPPASSLEEIVAYAEIIAERTLPAYRGESELDSLTPAELSRVIQAIPDDGSDMALLTQIYLAVRCGDITLYRQSIARLKGAKSV